MLFKFLNRNQPPNILNKERADAGIKKKESEKVKRREALNA